MLPSTVVSPIEAYIFYGKHIFKWFYLWATVLTSQTISILCTKAPSSVVAYTKFSFNNQVLNNEKLSYHLSKVLYSLYWRNICITALLLILSQPTVVWFLELNL